MDATNPPLIGLLDLSDEEKRRRILESLDDVDAGRVVPHDEVTAWAQSLFGQSSASK